MRRPVAVYTSRKGKPFVLFGKHYDGDTPYGDTGKTFNDVAGDAACSVQTFFIQDGPHIADMADLFDTMERAGVVMLTKDEG
jgi:hypothetical protein